MPNQAKKPVKLQINNSGAWKDVVFFDADDDDRSLQIMMAAARLYGVVNEGLEKPQLAMRIVTAEAVPVPLIRCEDIVRDDASMQPRGRWFNVLTGQSL